MGKYLFLWTWSKPHWIFFSSIKYGYKNKEIARTLCQKVLCKFFKHKQVLKRITITWNCSFISKKKLFNMNVSRKYIRQMKRVNTLFTVECHILVLKRTMVRRIEFHQTNWETPVDTWLSTYKTMPALSLEKLRITQTYNFESLLCLQWKCIRGTFWLNVQYWTVHRPAWRWW